jgi:threonine dehydrogenase-like Zn-dependent dehydrogenase
MRAITIVPGHEGSAELRDLADPSPRDGELLVEGVALGICGTDREIIAGDLGEAPEGEERLVLGHESLGRVLSAPDGSGYAEGDLVVGIVRRPDPEPCSCCAAGNWDFCRNGRFTERGIRGRHGFGSERWTVETDFAVAVPPEVGELGVLLEPTSVLAKAWELIDGFARVGCRPLERLLVTGAGPIGLLAAMLGRQRWLEVHVFNRSAGGTKEELVRDLGGTLHTGELTDVPAPDVVVECTGAGAVVIGAMRHNRPGALVCLTGVTGHADRQEVDVGSLNDSLVMENDVVFGTVNANRRHWEAAAEALQRADQDWLRRMITRRVPLDRFQEALERRDGDVKVVVDLGG